MRNRHLPRLCRSCQAPSEAGPDMERWANEGGSFASEVGSPSLGATAARR